MISKQHTHMGKCYGSTTVGERGQIVIPIEARKELNLEPGSKLLVFGTPSIGGLMCIKAEDLASYLSIAMERLTRLERMVKDAEDR